MRKTILAVCVALAIFMCNAVPASAASAVCSKSPDGHHHFNDCWSAGAGHNVYGGTHSYIYGYDENENPIYRNDCELWLGYEYCTYMCRYCQLKEGNQHEHYVGTFHTVYHK